MRSGSNFASNYRVGDGGEYGVLEPPTDYHSHCTGTIFNTPLDCGNRGRNIHNERNFIQEYFTKHSGTRL